MWKPVYITVGMQLAKIKTSRAAVVPYIVYKNKLYFLFGRDRVTGEITDLGGGVKEYEFSLSAALREFREESNEIFGSIYYQINACSLNVCLVGSNMSTMFLPLDVVWYYLAPSVFLKNRTDKLKRSHNEISELIWLNDYQIKEMLYSDKKCMWVRIKNFYRASYNENLKRMLKMLYRKEFIHK
jgi:hypothetical protein